MYKTVHPDFHFAKIIQLILNQHTLNIRFSISINVTSSKLVTIE